MANNSQQISTVTVNMLELENQSNLTNNALTLLGQQTGPLPNSSYAAALYVLVYGAQSLGTNIHIDLPPPWLPCPDVLIDQEFIKGIHLFQGTNPGLQKLQYATPAGKNGFFKPAGDGVGGSAGLTPQNQAPNPMSGEPEHIPPLIRNALQKVKHNYFEDVNKYIKKIKTDAYLAAPKTSFGSVEKIALLLSDVNALCSSLEQLLMDIYRGAIEAVRIFIAYINGLMSMLQQYINNLIEQIIPPDLMCLFLQVLQFFVKDIASYTSTFSQILSITNIQGMLNQHIGKYTAYIAVPDLWSLLPADVRNILELTQQFVSNPKAFLGNSIKNMASNYVMQNLQGKFIGQVKLNYSNNVSYVGAYNMVNNNDLLKEMSQTLKQSSPVEHYQSGTGDPVLTNRYAEKISSGVATSSYEVNFN
jgi:hypothetical protein